MQLKKSKNILAIIQARSTSTRFPGKALEKVLGIPLVLRSVLALNSIGVRSVVAIPKGDRLKRFLESERVSFFEGSERNVLKRFFLCSKRFPADYYARITADCPVLPISTFMLMTYFSKKHEFDFNSNCIKPCVDGYEIEIMSSKILKWAYNNGKNSYDKEHVTTVIKSNIGKLSKKGFSFNHHAEPYNHKWFPKLSVDRPEDIKRIEISLKGVLSG